MFDWGGTEPDRGQKRPAHPDKTGQPLEAGGEDRSAIRGWRRRQVSQLLQGQGALEEGGLDAWGLEVAMLHFVTGLSKSKAPRASPPHPSPLSLADYCRGTVCF